LLVLIGGKSNFFISEYKKRQKITQNHIKPNKIILPAEKEKKIIPLLLLKIKAICQFKIPKIAISTGISVPKKRISFL
jgi:hypothetical protein